MFKIDVDPGDLFKRALSELEQKNLPFALQQTANRTAEEVQRQWIALINRTFDSPVSLTRNSVKVKMARYTRGASGGRINHAAEVFIRDLAHKGTPPARYLYPQVHGGARGHKGLERGLQRGHYLLASQYAVPAKTAPLDSHGNVQRGLVPQILSQLKLQRDDKMNETKESRGERRGKQARKFGRTYDFFALSKRKGRLPAGVYERSNDKSRALRMIFLFVPGVKYRPRLDLFGKTKKTWDSVFPFHFEREMKKAIENSKFKDLR